jgi:hypothetical protein
MGKLQETQAAIEAHVRNIQAALRDIMRVCAELAAAAALLYVVMLVTVPSEATWAWWTIYAMLAIPSLMVLGGLLGSLYMRWWLRRVTRGLDFMAEDPIQPNDVAVRKMGRQVLRDRMQSNGISGVMFLVVAVVLRWSMHAIVPEDHRWDLDVAVFSLALCGVAMLVIMLVEWRQYVKMHADE